METVPFELKSLIEYIPLCIIIIIIIISTLTWNVITDKIQYLVTLIFVFVFAVYLYLGDSISVSKWKGYQTAVPNNNPNQYILPTQQLITLQQLITNITSAENITKIMMLLCSIVFIAIGIYFGVKSTKYDRPQPLNNGALFITIGSIFTGLSILAGIYILITIFRDNDNAADDNKNKVIVPLSFIGIIIGAYFIITGTNIDKNIKNGTPIDKSKEVTIDYKSLNLVGGLLFQITGIVALLAITYFLGILHSQDVIHRVFRFIITLTLFIAGVAISAKDGKDSVYISHGAIYLILSCVAIFLCIGELKKFETYWRSGLFLIFLLIGLFFWNLAISGDEMSQKVDNDYSQGYIENDPTNIRYTLYQQIKNEANEEYKRTYNKDPSSRNIDPSSDVDTNFKTIVDKKIAKLKETEKSNAALNFTVTLISLCLVILMTAFRYVKYQITDKDLLPQGLREAVGLAAAAGAAAGTKFPKSGYLTNNRIDNLTANDWNDIVSLKDSIRTAAGQPQRSVDFSTTVVTFASLSRWNMFGAVVLIILWVIVIYMYVTTSQKTDEWIATSFDATMYSKVKELLGAFFITILIALSVAAVLLIPVVKEFSSSGIDNLLKFAESIQVWQWTLDPRVDKVKQYGGGAFIALVLWILAMIPVWIWLSKKGNTLPGGLIFYTILVTLFFWFFKGVIYTLWGATLDPEFNLETRIIRYFRAILTTLYLIPLSAWTLIKCVIWGLLVIFTVGKMDNIKEGLTNELEKFWKIMLGTKLTPNDDLRFFGGLFGREKPTPSDVTSVKPIINPLIGPPNQIQPLPTDDSAVTIDQTKVSLVTKLIKTIIIIVSCIMVILTIIYGFYQFKQKSVTSTSTDADGNVSSSSSTTGLDPATTTFIYVILVVVGIAGLVAFLRDKMNKTGAEDPERLIFDDLKPEDANKPGRQLTFAVVHVLYVVFMIIVWIYDRDGESDNKMSILGMAILGFIILLFHFCLEVADTNDVADKIGTENNISLLFENIRFLVNVVFFVLLIVLSYYKLYALMVLFIIVMFMFHLSKSKLGILILKLLWLCIIYVPCLILDAIVGGRNMLGSTTRPIWIILIVETILLIMLFGLPYLINKAGVSKSQIILAPVPLMNQHDTKLTTESSEIFIFHNTAMNRSDADNDANCPPEEKKRYSYSISGWFWLNDTITKTDKDMVIFDFAGVPTITYNPSTTNFKVSCNAVGTDGTVYDGNAKKIVYQSIDKDIVNTSEYKEFVMSNELQIIKQIPLQKWNYFVINYDGKTMDVFLNDELIGKSGFIIPNITVERITSGESTNRSGLSGNICNVVFNKQPMTSEQIRWTYNALKTLEPPLVGTKTVADDVNSGVETDVYSQ
jgi:hypothetical protein